MVHGRLSSSFAVSSAVRWRCSQFLFDSDTSDLPYGVSDGIANCGVEFMPSPRVVDLIVLIAILCRDTIIKLSGIP